MIREFLYRLYWGRTRRRIAGQVLSSLLGSPATRIDGEPYNLDIHLPELAEAAISAADALIEASRLPRNKGLKIPRSR